MEHRILGKTGLSISPMAFGTMEFGFVDKKHAGLMLGAALDAGVNYVDTAPEYPNAEYYIGQTIAHRRDDYILATKCGDNMTGIGEKYLFDRKTIVMNVEESLRLMKTDHIDVLQLHGMIPEFLPGGEADEALEAVRELKQSGKVLHIGATFRNGGSWEYGYPAVFAYHSVPFFAPLADIEMLQLVYGALTRTAEKVIQAAHDRYNTGFIARGIIKQYDSSYSQRWDAARLDELLEKGESRTDFLIRYALSHPAIASVVIGTKNRLHMLSNLKAVEKGPLSPEIYAQAKRRLNYAGCISGDIEVSFYRL